MSNQHRALKKRKKKSSVWRTIRNIIFGLILLAAIVGTGVLSGMFVAVTREMEELNIKNATLNFSSFVYCNDVKEREVFY